MSVTPPEQVEEQARQAYDAVNRGDLDAFMALIHPDVEFHVLTAEFEGGTFRGHEGVREWWDHVKGAFSGLRFEAEWVDASEDRGLAQLLVTGTMAGVDVPQRMWQAFELRDGTAVWWKSFRSEAEARSALEDRAA